MKREARCVWREKREIWGRNKVGNNFLGERKHNFSGETDTQCTILLRSEAGNSSELLNEEKHLKWGREKLRLDPPHLLNFGHVYTVELWQSCKITASFSTGCPFLVHPPPSYSTLGKDDIGSIFGENGSLLCVNSLPSPWLHLNLQPWFVCSHKYIKVRAVLAAVYI